MQRGRFSGLYQEKESFLYVSNGQSNWGPRVRLYSTPENTVLVLRHAETFAAEGGAVDLSWRRENWWAVLGLVLLPGWVVGMIVSRTIIAALGSSAQKIPSESRANRWWR